MSGAVGQQATWANVDPDGRHMVSQGSNEQKGDLGLFGS